MTIGATVESFKGPLPQGKQMKESERVSHELRDLEHMIDHPQHVVLHSAPLPDSMLLGVLRHPRLRLKTSLRVNLSTENGYIIAECPDLNEFGYGPHLMAAITDLQHTIAELYFTLKEEQGRLGGDLPGLWVTLQAKIEER
mgnify:CR=1 FL=1